MQKRNMKVKLSPIRVVRAVTGSLALELTSAFGAAKEAKLAFFIKISKIGRFAAVLLASAPRPVA